MIRAGAAAALALFGAAALAQAPAGTQAAPRAASPVATSAVQAAPPAPPTAPAANAPSAAGPAATAPAAAQKPAGPPELPPIEYTLTAKEGAWRVRVTLRPGQPEPGQPLDILLDVAKHPDIPDPTFGDRIPLDRAVRLALVFSGPGQRQRHRLWPLGDAGIYGTHFTPPSKGLWTATLEPLDTKAEAPRASFQIGAGVPMPASSEGQAVHASRVILAGSAPMFIEPGRPLRETMHDLGEKFGPALEARADDPAALKAMALLARAAVAHVPAKQAADAAEFDKLAVELADTLEVLAATPTDQRRGKLSDLNVESCLRCHAKFRDGVVSDLSRWPEVKPWRR